MRGLNDVSTLQSALEGDSQKADKRKGGGVIVTVTQKGGGVKKSKFFADIILV